MNPTDTLVQIRSLTKAYEKFCAPIRQETGLGQREIDIIAFLKNNPERNTAKDIVELRMMPKTNVSFGVDALMQNGYISRETDPKDRRRLHLKLTEPGNTIAEKVTTIQNQFAQMLFTDFTAEDKKNFSKISQQLTENAIKYLGGH